MKKIFIFLFAATLLNACSSDDNNRRNNPNLLDVNVNFTVDTSLPQYNSLNFPNDPIYISNYGNGGIILMNTGSGYLAWDNSDPNHPRNNNCISMQRDGLTLVCDCEGNTYDIFTGNFIEGTDLEYTLYNYRVTETSPGILRVSNN
ncbi:hypothetical protein KW502_01070 [Mesonia sp. JHPTF-M18]|uniref:Rieske domain-containing protein n=2 Tax=Mesonia aestuariivivens TaxID=2796128 RepID=A0ABS6VXT2_9FLAO|nr:hypothetical protein [Mesonia aestuariivivens]